MSGNDVDAEEEAKLKGISKYFNNVTIRGRANVALATYIFLAGLGVYYYMKPKTPKN